MENKLPICLKAYLLNDQDDKLIHNDCYLEFDVLAVPVVIQLLIQNSFQAIKTIVIPRY